MLQSINVTIQSKLSTKGDFKVNGKYVFEVGGKNKTQKQIQGLTRFIHAFVVVRLMNKSV